MKKKRHHASLLPLLYPGIFKKKSGELLSKYEAEKNENLEFVQYPQKW